ncbi:MAG: class I SAM-dependent methyltransferase [Ignavibacteriaceae bacterium]|nr:class I SAM-dependent methyltransferase [Ignavibacteriaceae bacterium]
MATFKANFWDERYSANEYVYGTEPNQFFKEQLAKVFPAGKLILPGEGEGRNAVYAASQGWQVDAFDQSPVAMQKAKKLAETNGVNFNYSIVDLLEFKPKKIFYDCAAVIFVHFSPVHRNEFHKNIIDSLKPGGRIILELFSKNQYGKSSGGPQALEMLYSLEDIKNDFKEIRTVLIEDKNVFLYEGNKHSGEASVIRFVGEKTA